MPKLLLFVSLISVNISHTNINIKPYGKGMALKIKEGKGRKAMIDKHKKDIYNKNRPS